jgi:hypothetical protein
MHLPTRPSSLQPGVSHSSASLQSQYVFVLPLRIVPSTDECFSRAEEKMSSFKNSSGSMNGRGKGSSSLTLDDILSDLSNLPRSSPSTSSSSLKSLELSAPLPNSSESVDSSLAISQALIDRSAALLEEANVLDSVQARLQKVDESLVQVERELP